MLGLLFGLKEMLKEMLQVLALTILAAIFFEPADLPRLYRM